MDGDRLALAEAFLQEAVFQSRAKQAAGTALAAGASAKPTNCGLGREAAVVLELSPRGRELFDSLFVRESDDLPGGRSEAASPEDRSDGTPSHRASTSTPPAVDLARIRDVLSTWVERQDQLDRDRNHFLKAFRQRHGFDRRAYTPALLADYDSGLAEINARADRERREHASRILA
ncbi:MAG: hypothetical protein HZA52_10320 [Planctomycetes bacterium]|nr:hypothetical protein [Planctomycetota bacterium]